MSTVEFEEPKFSFNREVPIPEISSGPIIRIIIKTGIAKKQSSVNRVMFGMIAIFLVLSGILLLRVTQDKTIYREDLTADQLRELPQELIDAIPYKNEQR